MNLKSLSGWKLAAVLLAAGGLMGWGQAPLNWIWVSFLSFPLLLVVLSVGMEPSDGTREMARVLGVTQNKYGFIAAGGPGGLDPVATSRPGVFVVGAAAGPSDMDDSISTAGLAAARAVALVRRQ